MKEKIAENTEIKKLYEESYNADPGKYSNYVLILPGESIETALNGENILMEPRLKIIKDNKKGDKK